MPTRKSFARRFAKGRGLAKMNNIVKMPSCLPRKDVMDIATAIAQRKIDVAAGRLAIEAMVADEREACAVCAEQYTENGDSTPTDETQRWTAETIAADIRRRNNSV